MNAKLKKTIKICVWILAILILLPIVLLATLPLWLGPVVKPSLNAIAPKFTKTDFRIEKLYLNPYTCNFELGGIRIGNPEGFSETNAVTLGYFNVDVDTESLFTDVIVVENVEISDIFVSMVRRGDKKTNFDVIKENIAGSRKELEQEVEKEREQQVAEERKEGVPEEQIKAEEAQVKRRLNKKIIVNRFVFRNISGKVTVPGLGLTVPLAVPSIEIKDIGRDSGGLDLDGLFAAVMKEFWANVANSAGDLGGMLGNGAGKAVDALKGTADSLKNVGDSTLKGATDTLKGAGDSLKGAGDSLKKLFK